MPRDRRSEQGRRARGVRWPSSVRAIVVALGLIANLSWVDRASAQVVPMTREDYDWMVHQQVGPLLDDAEAEYARLGFIGSADARWFHALEPGDSHEAPLSLQAGVHYSIAVFCDGNCVDLDVYLESPSGSVVNSDEAPAPFGIVEVTPPASGQYTIRVKLLGCNEPACVYGGGVFARDLREGGNRAVLLQHTGRLSSTGEELPDGKYAVRHTFTVSGSGPLRIDLMSPDFDTYLVLFDPTGERFDNDDFEGRTDQSRVEIAYPVAGTWELVATSYGPGVTGEYEVVATQARR